MKKFIPIFFIILVLILISCPNNIEDKTVKIKGTVNIARNGLPWNSENFSEIIEWDYIPNRPTERPRLLAFTSLEYNGQILEYDLNNHIGTAYAINSPINNIDGTYNWEMDIPYNKLPCLIYFEISLPMKDIYFNFGMRNIGARKVTEGIWVSASNQNNVDIGLINFNIIQLSGNLPVTINGEPIDYEDDQYSLMGVYHSLPFTRFTETLIFPNGDWSFTVAAEDFPMPLSFQIEASKNGGLFKQYLNGSFPTQALEPENLITIHDIDKEIIFPSYPTIDIKAHTLSGTIEITQTENKRFLGIIYFVFDKNHFYSGFDGSLIDYPNMNQSEGRAGFFSWDLDSDGVTQWSTMIPAFSFPHVLYALFRCHYENGSRSFESNYFEIEFNSVEDLTNINLGVFNIN